MNTIEKKSLKVGKYVSTEHVDTLVRNYKKDRWMQNSENLGKQDTLGIWFSIEELEEFLQTAKLNGADGVRLNFGVYGDNAPRKGMEGRQTIALVASSSNEASVMGENVYVERNGKSELLAYNAGLPFPIQPPPPGRTTVLKGDEIGSLMVADENGLTVI
jgi:hypothetical protein